jgi:glycerophosphoryl diester phosphodiesterase
LYSISASSQNSLIIAHRGASAYAPENTLSAFEKAIKMKAMAIETDVHQTKDSVLVLMHDESVDRTTNGKGLIKDMLFDDFKKLEIRSPLSVKTEHPPSLEEALALVHSRCQLLIEIKRASDYYPGIEKRLVELIKKCHAEHDIKAIHSFEKQALVNVAKVDSLIPLQKLIVFKLALGNLSFDKHFIKDDFKTWEGVNVHSRFCSKRIIRKLHRLGKTVYVWTVNDPKKAGKFVKRGVDGIITNDPDILNKKALIKSGL